MRLTFLAAALVVAAPAAAEDLATAGAVQVKTGQTIRDANAARLGSITRVLPNGSAVVIYDGRFVTIPASTLTVADGKVSTSLTKKDLRKL